MKTLTVLIALQMIASLVFAQTKFEPNYDESKVPNNTLPDPLVFENGTKVENKSDWKKRRAEILKLFEEEVYGISPKWEGKMEVDEVRRSSVFDGLGTKKELKLTFKNKGKEVPVMLLLYVPQSEKPAPVFLGYNFYGNHTVANDKEIAIAASWVRNNPALNITNNKATEETRGSAVSSWPIKDILQRGYAVGTIYYGDVDPDFDDGFQNGIHALFDEKRSDTSWGSIATWAWGLSRALDYLKTDKDVDSKKAIVIGHSRLGKTALWAGAIDERFAMVVSNDSGCGGAALSRRKFGETVYRINTSFPHWFCDRFNKYNNQEESLPVDQHQLIALIAPRPVYVASATEDLWADPKGEFLAALHAEPVYKLFDLEGLGVSEMPKAEQPVGKYIGYHLRNGQHAITLYDWTQYMNFADQHFKTTKARK